MTRLDSLPLLLAASGGNGPVPNPWMILPFGILLLAIALMPFVAKSWWHHHYPKIATALGGLVVAYYVFVLKDAPRMLHVAHEYVTFLALLGSLFVVAGGIHITVKGQAKPGFNCLFLLAGSLLANLIGTTGASILLVRPWIRMNRPRIAPFHIVFFIFLVSNIGGCLTPIGDPPLFLGYLKGVPFWWVLQNCWAHWLIANAFLLLLFYIIDRRHWLRAPRPADLDENPQERWRFDGLHNLAFLALILLGVFARNPPGLSETLMILAALGSWFTTPRRIHAANSFNFEPIREVAWLFLGIFACMVPALDYLALNAGSLNLNQEVKLFWLTGLLSAGLDNAPTYLTFLAAAMGSQSLNLNAPVDVLTFITTNQPQLIAISVGSVFFGAMTYIGNGPNFMVKAIAEHAKLEVPSFFGYLLRYAVPVLLPLFVIITWLFFWR